LCFCASDCEFQQQYLSLIDSDFDFDVLVGDANAGS
jgi:hypothetical protein